MENKELEKLLEQLSDKARDISCEAAWFEEFQASALAEYYRYSHHVVLEVIEAIRAKCSTLDEVRAQLGEMGYECYNEFKYYQREKFEHFAELAMVKDRTLSYIAAEIARNEKDGKRK